MYSVAGFSSTENALNPLGSYNLIHSSGLTSIADELDCLIGYTNGQLTRDASIRKWLQNLRMKGGSEDLIQTCINDVLQIFELTNVHDMAGIKDLISKELTRKVFPRSYDDMSTSDKNDICLPSFFSFRSNNRPFDQSITDLNLNNGLSLLPQNSSDTFGGMLFQNDTVDQAAALNLQTYRNFNLPTEQMLITEPHDDFSEEQYSIPETEDSSHTIDQIRLEKPVERESRVRYVSDWLSMDNKPRNPRHVHDVDGNILKLLFSNDIYEQYLAQNPDKNVFMMIYRITVRHSSTGSHYIHPDEFLNPLKLKDPHDSNIPSTINPIFIPIDTLKKDGKSGLMSMGIKIITVSTIRSDLKHVQQPLTRFPTTENDLIPQTSNKYFKKLSAAQLIKQYELDKSQFAFCLARKQSDIEQVWLTKPYISTSRDYNNFKCQEYSKQNILHKMGAKDVKLSSNF
ncbi:unnamed protein product [Didymodactylos carnosus]|uniref:Uncharacterized protein n=1 Tax=Didymodactylos carnosus TaxID=1234261 RepID=A0A815BXX9_9BILA|nr:unnamed protein product [Didymodactylos carnosus]CAF1277897.1 unnamed protein product [Didymodactylos carnosus]CAF3851171.1 unnamed protein product [Didymodactylos carnosus]CAF4071110.1 unnamed protein product [Didymodactylos carnosus]